MKTKYIIIILLALLLATGLFFGLRKVSAANKIEVGIYDFKPEISLKSLPDILALITNFATLTLPAKVSIELKNFSNQIFQITQIKADVYTESGQFLGGPVKPLQSGTMLNANANTVLPIDYTLSVSALGELARNLPGDDAKGKVKTLLVNYFQNGKFGVNIRVKGFVTAENITVKFDELLDV